MGLNLRALPIFNPKILIISKIHAHILVEYKISPRRFLNSAEDDLNLTNILDLS